jgi:hypothetical protein
VREDLLEKIAPSGGTKSRLDLTYSQEFAKLCPRQIETIGFQNIRGQEESLKH